MFLRNKNIIKKIGLLLISILALSACKSDDNFSGEPDENSTLFADVDLYYTGTVEKNPDESELKYWKNDEITAISTTERAIPTDIAVIDNEVFVSGNLQKVEENSVTPLHGVIWKNGVSLYNLEGDENNPSTVEALIVENNTIHAAGVINRREVAYWKNGVLSQWTNLNNLTRITAMDVVGDDVYILGDVQPSGSPKHIITYWKNGEEHAITSPDELCYAADIKVIDNDVYVLGTVVEGGYQIALWKNGLRTNIGDLYVFGYAQNLFIENNNIYIGAYMQPTGRHISPFLFKNGVSLPLDFNPGEVGYLEDIYVNNDDVYALGHQDSDTFIWKNGARHVIREGNAHVKLSKITGVPKNK